MSRSNGYQWARLLLSLGLLWASACGLGRPAVTLTAAGSPAAAAPSVTRAPAPAAPTRTASPAASVTARENASATPGSTATPASDPVLIAAGDIAQCGNAGAGITAQLVEAISGTVATLGDNAYETGTAKEYADCYDPTWGRFKARTRPTPGNHDYGTGSGSAYFAYFGAAAGRAELGFYSYDLGAWHIIALNSSCLLAGCGADSIQGQWLREDLAAHPRQCVLAYWHYPLYSSGEHGNVSLVQPFWQILYAAGADVVLNGHDHTYERFALQDPNGQADPARGLREFVVGTGGAGHYNFAAHPQPNSEVRDNSSLGVLKLTLHSNSYAWEFIPEPGKSFQDAGQAACHNAP